MQVLQITLSTAFYFFFTYSLSASEFIMFHVTTIEGIAISGVNVRIAEDPKQAIRSTTDDGFCMIELKIEELKDINIIVFKKDWTVVRPKLGSYFRVDYRDKLRVIEIQMQQNEEIYQLSKNLVFAESPLVQNPNTLTEYNSTYSREPSYMVQIKASNAPIATHIIEMWEQKMALKIYLQYIPGSLYPYKYRIKLGVKDRDPAKQLLSAIHAAGFKDAFLVQDY